MRVLLADDHSIVRTALRHLLSEIDENLTVVEAKTFDEAQAACVGDRALDLIVLDLRMPGYEGQKSLRELVGAAQQVPVVVFSMLETPAEMRAVLAQGVRAYIPKSTDDGLIVKILGLVLAGGTYVPPVLGGVQGGREPEDVRSGPSRPTPVTVTGLTPRQTEVLALMAEGLSNHEIGARMGLNLSTIKSHVTSILKTLDVDNRTQAVLVFKQSQS